MWSFNLLRRQGVVALVCALPLLVAACGFTPVYARPDAGGAAAMQEQLQDVEIGMIADREGQYLRNALLDQMAAAPSGRAQRYFLRVHQLKYEDDPFGIRKDATSTRGDITLTATMELIDNDSGAVLLTRHLRSRGGYNRLDNLYGSLVTKEDAVNRLLDETAERIVTELTLYLGRA